MSFSLRSQRATYKVFVVLLVFFFAFEGAAQSGDERVLMQRENPALLCVANAQAEENSVRIIRRLGEREVQINRRFMLRLRRQIRQLRLRRQQFAESRPRITRRLTNRRRTLQFFRQCRQAVPALTPAPTPAPTPVATPHPTPPPSPTPVVEPAELCSEITVRFADFTAGEYPADVFNSEGDLLTDGGVLVNYNADVTFHFDRDYPCGQFVTGDWWVEGPVTVTAMSPEFEDDRHGYEVDPSPGSQSLDGRIASYSPPQGELPLHLDPEDSSLSLVKAVSFAPQLDCLHIIRNHNRRPCLLSAAVLTVVSEIPAKNSFRPPYIHGQKPIIDATALDLDLLPRLAATPNVPALSSVAGYFGGPWIDYVTGWSGRFLHPRANMRGANPHDSSAYGARMANGINVALLRSFHEESNEEKLSIVIPLVQLGIDLYHQALAGQSWRDDGGHMLGRKAPILYAGHLLRATSHGQQMLSVMEDLRATGPVTEGGALVNELFQEDGHTYYGRNGVALFGGTKGDSSGYYGGSARYNQKLNNCNGSRDVRDPDGYRDGGILTFSHNDAATMPQSLINFLAKYGEGGEYVDEENPPVQYVNRVAQCGVYNVQLPTVAQQLQSGERYTSAYQGCCTSKQYMYTATAIRLLGLEHEWDHPAFFDYVERFGSAPWDGVGGYGSGYGDRMFLEYYPRS